MPLYLFRHLTNLREFALTNDASGACLPQGNTETPEWLYWLSSEEVIAKRITSHLHSKEDACADIEEGGYHIFHWPPLSPGDMVI